MQVNGVQEKLEQAATLRAYLEARGMDAAKVAVERNGEIVPRAQFDAVMLEDTDVLEIVSFVGGG